MRRIYATRPAKQNASWVTKLQQRNLSVVQLPLLEIKTLDAPQLAIAETNIQNLNEYQKLIFVSQNAVEIGLSKIDDYWPQLPLGLQLFAVGSSTGKLLRQTLDDYFGMEIECFENKSLDKNSRSDRETLEPPSPHSVISASEAMNSEALLSMPQLQNVEHEKILIFRGVGGRPMLAEVLEQRSATVHFCELYERAFPGESAELAKSIRLLHSDILPVFSAESLENFYNSGIVIDKEALANLSVVVPGARVEQCAFSLGFERVFVAENATEACMLAAIDRVE